MFDKQIDVSFYMRKIIKEVNPSYKVGNIVAFEDNRNFDDTIKQIEHIQDYIYNSKRDIEPYLDICGRIPRFLRFPLLIRWPLSMFAKTVERSSRFITRNQTTVNVELRNMLGALLESEQYMLKELEHLHYKYQELEKRMQERGDINHEYID